jgi:hypothetical protein
MILWDVDGLRRLPPGTPIREVTGAGRSFVVRPGQRLSSPRSTRGTRTSGGWSFDELRLDFPVVTETLLDHYAPARSSRSSRTANATGARSQSSKARSPGSSRAS